MKRRLAQSEQECAAIGKGEIGWILALFDIRFVYR